MAADTDEPAAGEPAARGLPGLAAALAQMPVHSRLRGGVVEIAQDAPRAVYAVAPWAADPAVPVLYLDVYGAGDVPARSADALAAALAPKTLAPAFAPFVTQGEHPRTGLPTLFVHPCRTGEWLAELAAELGEPPTAPRVWLAWLTAFGNGVGLQLPDQ